MELAASFLRGRPWASQAEIGGIWADSSAKLLVDHARRAGRLGESMAGLEAKALAGPLVWLEPIKIW
jgi:hypothetical protein